MNNTPKNSTVEDVAAGQRANPRPNRKARRAMAAKARKARKRSKK
jgi:hypothetical protein